MRPFFHALNRAVAHWPRGKGHRYALGRGKGAEMSEELPQQEETSASAGTERVFTQEEVNTLVGQAKLKERGKHKDFDSYKAAFEEIQAIKEKGKSELQKAIDKFSERTAGKGREYVITVDDQGFVRQYVTGGSTSVAISAMAGELIVHNHPSGGAFSDSDLLSTAQDRSSGIVATGKNGSYIFRKGKNFNASGFARAVKNATMMGTGYDDAADKWLKANQSKYGYSYEFQKK